MAPSFWREFELNEALSLPPAQLLLETCLRTRCTVGFRPEKFANDSPAPMLVRSTIKCCNKRPGPASSAGHGNVDRIRPPFERPGWGITPLIGNKPRTGAIAR